MLTRGQAPLRRTHTATVIVQVAPLRSLAPLVGRGEVTSDAAEAPPLALPKARTSNYAENRAIDHRLGRSFPALPLLLDGDLEPLVEVLEQGGHGDR
jgi:hypothetical protein